MKFNKVKRNPTRGVYEEKWILELLDQSPFVHVGISTSSGPLVIPMAFGRKGEIIYLHGAISNHLLKSMEPDANICITCTQYDGLVLAKSVFHHSMNYRSAVLFGKPRLLEGDEKLDALEIITEHLSPGRWEQARRPNDQEFKATRVMAVEIEHASGKMRTGPPSDDDADAELPIWTGNVVSETKYTLIESDSDLPTPGSVRELLNV